MADKPWNNYTEIAASAAVNDRHEFDGILLSGGINLVCNGVGTGKIIVVWRSQST